MDALHYDRELAEAIKEEFGVTGLKKDLQNGLLKDYREMKVREIGAEYARCKQELTRQMKRALDEKNKLIRSAKAGAADLAKEAEKAKKEKEALEKKKEEIEETLRELKDFTNHQIGIIWNERG